MYYIQKLQFIVINNWQHMKGEAMCVIDYVMWLQKKSITCLHAKLLLTIKTSSVAI